MNTNGVFLELAALAYNGQYQMATLNNQMNAAQKAGNSLLYYKLRNEVILKRIAFQEGISKLRQNASFSTFNHEKITKLTLQLSPLKAHAEARRLFIDNQFTGLQIQKDIDSEFDQTDVLLNKIEKQLKKLGQFQEKHAVPLAGATLYQLNDQTQCHGPGCEETKFSKTLGKCGRCKGVLYCSELCQKKDWPAHKLVCKKID